MTEPRLASGVLLGALRRQVEAAGGSAAVLARGDPTAGAMLLLLADRGEPRAVLERRPDPAGRDRWERTAERLLADPAALQDYFTKRRRADPDLWLVELDIAQVERFAAETGLTG